jgi:hypothetical protein
MSVNATPNRIESWLEIPLNAAKCHFTQGHGSCQPYRAGEVKGNMKLVYSSKKIGGYLLAFFLLFGVITVASSSAQAQWRDRDRDGINDRYDRRDDRYRDRYYGYQTARQQGYSYGMNVGAADAQRGQSYDPQRSRYWRNATEGYSSSYGNKGQYKQVFRDAFEQGYREGFQRYAYNRRSNRGIFRWPR